MARSGISRRGFLRGRFRAAQPARHRPAVPLLRPPGAIAEEAFLERCTRCDECLKACPHDVLFHAPARLRAAAGTPTFDPAANPCRLCEGLPCIAACEPGALRPEAGTAMGTAFIDTQVCLAHQGTFCSACHERCPVPGAIAVTAGRPTIVPDACTGCGICQYVCPAPGNAVAVLPARVRPAEVRP